jgi:hypothetical protein
MLRVSVLRDRGNERLAEIPLKGHLEGQHFYSLRGAIPIHAKRELACVPRPQELWPKHARHLGFPVP